MRATGLLSVLPAVNVHSNEQPGGDFKTCKILQQHFNTRRRVFDLKCNVEQRNGFKVSFLLNIFMCFLALRLKRSRWVCDYLPLASALTHLHFERPGTEFVWVGSDRPSPPLGVVISGDAVPLSPPQTAVPVSDYITAESRGGHVFVPPAVNLCVASPSSDT